MTLPELIKERDELVAQQKQQEILFYKLDGAVLQMNALIAKEEKERSEDELPKEEN